MVNSEICVLDSMPLMLTVEEVASVLRIGRNSAYDLVRAKGIRSVHIGKKIRVPRDALKDYLAHAE